MIGRCLTAIELEFVAAQSERLLGLKFPANHAALLLDTAFNALNADWQALIVADMQFVIGELGHG